MVQPIDYINRIPMPDIGAKAIRLGQTLGARRDKIAAEKAAQEAQQGYRADLEAAFSSGRPEDFAALIAKHPQQREALKESWDVLNEGQKEAEFRESVNIYQAMQTDPEYGISLLNDRIAAGENSGEDVSSLRMIAEVAKQNPGMATNQIALTLSSLEPEKWSKMGVERRKRELESAEKTEAEADAFKAAQAAGFFESQTVLDMQKKGMEIKNLVEDIETKKVNRKLAVLNKQLENQQGSTKNQENLLKMAKTKAEIKKLNLERDIKIKDRVAEGEAAISMIDNSMNSIDQALSYDDSVFDRIIGVADEIFFSVGEAKELDGVMDTISAQSFLTNIDKISGQLTDQDALELKRAAANLTAEGNTTASLKRNLATVKRLLQRSRERANKKYGFQNSAADTPDVEISTEEALKILERNMPGFIDTEVPAEPSVFDNNLVRPIE